MSSVSFQSCECGIEFRIMKMLNDYNQKYTCECSREIKVKGTILDMHFRRAGGAGKDQDWTKADTWRIRD